MNRSGNKIDARQDYVLDRVNNRGSDKVDSVIREIAAELFLSPVTIWKDLASVRVRSNNKASSGKRY